MELVQLTFASRDAVVFCFVLRVQLGEGQVDDGARVARAGQGGLGCDSIDIDKMKFWEYFNASFRVSLVNAFS